MLLGTLLILLSMQGVFNFESIPHIERTSWIRIQRSQNKQCRGSTCLEHHTSGSRRNCPVERAERLRLAQLTQSTEYIPECLKNDGIDPDFAPIQCHLGTNTCWCVMPNGKPITGSTVHNKKPNCLKYRQMKKIFISRRSSASEHTKKPRRACNYADRSKFNAALVKTFRSEFIRIRTLTSLYSDLEPNDDIVVLTWKFDHLDKNKDGLLHRNETDNLKRLVKQQIQPRSCANSFVPVCAHGDKKITKLEWLDCLRVGESQLRSLPGSTAISPPLTTRLRTSEPVAEPNNCWTDRQSALTSQQLDSNKSIIIPECTPDGKYKKTQCAQGRAYCWCVNETTGLEVVDSVTVNTALNCDKLMTACLGKKKERFIEDLLDMFTRMAATGDQRRFQEIQKNNNVSIQEQVAKLNFERLDENHNGFLDRREWKLFKSETSAVPNLKPCGKKFPRHCDVNKDAKVSSTEWATCLQLKRTHHSSRRTSQRASGGLRTGKNPFTTILQR